MANLQETKRCPTCNQPHRRSTAQNARLHKLFQLMSEHFKGKDGLYHPALWWKVCMKHQWLGYDEFKLPNGETVYSMRSTADLHVDELNKFMERVERFAAEKNVLLQD